MCHFAATALLIVERDERRFVPTVADGLSPTSKQLIHEAIELRVNLSIEANVMDPILMTPCG